MKKFSNILYVIFFCVIMIKSKNKQETKFEKIYRECSNTRECKQRLYDENCLLRCVSELCYREIYGNYLLEFGEVNTELKFKFEKCFNTLNK